MDDSPASSSPPTEYVHNYVINVLSKASLDEEELGARLRSDIVTNIIPVHSMFSQ